MQVFLAGYNLDAELIEEFKQKFPDRKDITPETLSAAYARISRDQRPINQLREVARQEVEKARVSNERIIFDMGHSSVAEHAVFNFDVINVSRLAMEELEKFRLSSFTEKSQRYITLEKDFMIPEEIKNTTYEEKFTKLVEKQANLYKDLNEKLKEYVFENNRELAADPKNVRLLEGWAKEDARYITSLATCSQVGMTFNARNLEKLFRRFASHTLEEINELGRSIYELVKDIAPSIIKYSDANDYDKNKYADMSKSVKDKLGDNTSVKTTSECNLIDYSADADNRLLAAMIFSSSALSYSEALSLAEKMSAEEKMDIIRAVNKNLKLYEPMIREYEFVDLTYDLVVSAACFGQLKRHRMASIVSQNYEPKLGITVPEAVRVVGMQNKFVAVCAEAEVLYNELKSGISLGVAEYALTNAHRKRVLMKLNARELYHVSRLREDAHAQWDIRYLTEKMTAAAREKMPLTMALIGGKDKFNSIYSKVFGVSVT